MSCPGWPGVVTRRTDWGRDTHELHWLTIQQKTPDLQEKFPREQDARTHTHSHIWGDMAGIEGNIIKKLKSLYVFMLADWMVPLLLLHSDSLMCCWWTRLDWTRMRTSTWTWTWTWMVAADWTNRPGGGTSEHPPRSAAVECNGYMRYYPFCLWHAEAGNTSENVGKAAKCRLTEWSKRKPRHTLPPTTLCGFPEELDHLFGGHI